MKSFFGIGILLITLVVLKSSIFILPEGQQAIILALGKPVGNPKVKPGVKFKLPFYHEVKYIEKRILLWDGDPNQIPTKDKKFILVDTTARWKITDPLKFIQTVQNERGAKARLDTIIDGSTRNAISNHNLVEAVRISNDVLKDMPESTTENQDTEKISVGREKLSSIIVENSNKELSKSGIEVIDVQLTRVMYEKSVEQKVFERMRSERFRIAEKIRSMGRAEKAKIEGRLAKELQVIKSEAYKKAEIIKGRGEAKSIKIFADAFSKNPKFFEFIKTMEAYKKSLKPDTKFILSSESDFFKFLKGR